MSEQVELEENNLCIPEDAFEKFQAVSMYQEEKCIMLPQKLPPSPKPPEPDKTITSPDVDKVVLSSCNELDNSVNSTEVKCLEEQPLSSSCVESSIGLEAGTDDTATRGTKLNNYEDDTDMVVSNSENVNNQGNNTLESLTVLSSVLTPRKRGRKPKKLVSPTPDCPGSSKNIQNPDISSTPFSSDPETSDMVTVVQKKRGRPRKIRNNLEIPNNRDLSSDLSSSDNFRMDDIPIKKPGKRGRPRGSGRKAPADTNIDNEIQSVNFENQLHEDLKQIQDTSNSDNIIETTPKKRKRKSTSIEKTKQVQSDEVNVDSNELLINRVSDDDLDDICLSKLKSVPDQSNTSKLFEELCSTENKTDSDIKDTSSDNHDQRSKVKRKRGRPKKNQIQSIDKLDQVPDVVSSNDLSYVQEDADDVSLSKLKTLSDEPVITGSVPEVLDTEIQTTEVHSSDIEISEIPNTETESTETKQSVSEMNGTPSKRNSKMPVMADFEYNIDSVIANENTDINDKYADNSLLIEDTSKRPIRRKIKTLKYEEESDEDPFANVELSDDDEPRKGRRGNKYYSDDEYIPGKRGYNTIPTTDSEISDSELEKTDEFKKQRRRKLRKKSDNQSPLKRGKKVVEPKPTTSDGTSVEQNPEITQTDDLEVSLEPAVIKPSDGESRPFQPSQKWGTTTEFENFLAKKIQGTNLKIKKVSSNVPTESSKMEIPVLDPEAKKTIEMCTQTSTVSSTSIAVQTVTPYDSPIVENIALTPEQSEKACYFLNSIVKTTAELGLLMTQKSEDFIKKKINTSHVTDTSKMDYCVKKSFLLFKLAKHNLLQMEEDLAKQYDQFLETNNLTKCRQEQKKVLPTPKKADSDSDCEIVDVKPSPQTKTSQKSQGKAAFNPKTVFLNKELSIKIAKKPNEGKKLDIKGRHTVWINDTVMVKKVKPTQSFLAQDSRNKKPPDYITADMVSDFFKEYNRQRALSACAPFVSTDWLNVSKECVCNYFVVKPLQFNTDDNYSENDGFSISGTASGTTVSEPSESLNDVKTKAINTAVLSPEPLFTLCFRRLKDHLFYNAMNHSKEVTHKIRHELTDGQNVPVTLFRLCMRIVIDSATNDETTNNIEIHPTSMKLKSSCNATEITTLPLKSLCHRKIVELLIHPTISKTEFSCNTTEITILPLKSLCHRKIVELQLHPKISKPEFSCNNTEIKTLPLKSVCHRKIEELQSHPTISIPESLYNATKITTLPLKSLCHRKVVKLLADSNENKTKDEQDLYVAKTYYLKESSDSLRTGSQVLELRNNRNGMKSLFSLCIDYIQKTQNIFVRTHEHKNNVSTPKSLKLLAFESVKYLLYIDDFTYAHQCDEEPVMDGLMINCVNSLSEEAFSNLQQYNTDTLDSSEYLDDFDNGDDYDADLIENDQEQTEPSWVSQVQMQELRSCVNIANEDIDELRQMEPIITHIKVEPLDDAADNFLEVTNVKSEPIPGPDEMTIIPDVKPEIEEHINAGPIERQNSSSYDVDAFEQFVCSSKLMKSLTEHNTEEIYSQSSARVRRQHEPDYYEESNADMLGLLVPHTYEPMHIQTAKGSLMESSSDEGSKNAKTASKKVVVKRRGRPKKSEQKTNNKVISTPVSALPKEKEKGTTNEVALLTRKMKERIRQQEKKDESSDSETENVTVRLRNRDKKETSDQIKDKLKPSQNKDKNSEIQCNNVDSTDQIEDDVVNFTGFTSIETNEMSNYEKYMKFVYDKVIPAKEEEIAKEQLNSKNKTEAPIINPNEPVELLECEPTIPMFEESTNEVIAPKESQTKVAKPAKEVANDPQVPDVPFIDRHGWQCYPVNSGDPKLYQNACIYLEKLPESFVQTYFQYQNISTRDRSDDEINRLTNLNSLNRATNTVRKPHNTSKRDAKDGISETVNEDEDGSRTASAIDSDHYEELMPSDDEGPKVEDEVPLPVQRQTENTLAKNLLMNDNESDDDVGVKIKKEVETGDTTNKPKHIHKKKAKCEPEQEPSGLMLTADKMMNKELTLLHAPVVLDDEVKDIPTKGPITRHTKKSGTKPSPPNNKMKSDDDSSSEEEKQWVSTKEKLLKRMGKKESTSADDAKRAKLVSEFIERREGNLHDSHKRRPGRTRRSGKKFLERQKQLRVLQRELFGETSTDPTVSKRSGAAWKGRRNIRKVLDKKSLARSTVIANMEEFERKRRLNTRQTKLRELLGCEEGVNVLVINDEVCLEYDFEEHRPVVTIHPFFTKVMKAHQYEGVKFMWDACFESLADIEAGHAGGGCILAHCMGLGKTLQVLALLHTVLTHPRVGMHRVLVCCPLSTVLNWVDEIHKWIGPVTNQIKVFELSKLKKTYQRAYQLEDWYNGGGIFIIGYELFRSLSTLDPLLDDVRPTIVNKIRTALLDPGPDIIVCDEGHLLKNDCSVLAVSMSRVVTKRRIVLTGTPMQNNLREYYCMVNFVKPNLLGTYSEYSNRFENPIMNGQHRDSREEDIKLMKARTHILHKVLEGCLQRQEASVLYPYLPKKHEYTVFITLTKCQWDLYKHYMKHYSKQLKQNSILKDFHILQKIWSHPQVLHNFQTKSQETKNKIKLEKLEDDLATEDQEDIKDGVATELWWLQYLEGGDMLDSLETSNKFVVVFRILDECVALGDKVLIFSTSLFCLDVLEYFLKKINKWSLGHEYYRLDGSVPPEVRQKWCREFNAENNVNTKLFLVSTRAGCLGLNMTAANRVIIMDTSWNPAHDIQSIFRVYRFGQKKDCYIYRLVAMGTMEQKIYERSVTKQAVACRVVDEQQIDRHYNSAELTELYRYDEAGASVAGGVAVGVCDVALLRVARETALHAVHEHDSLLRSSEQGLPEHERAAAWMQFQQEQTHKQMENKLIANIPKISLKRVQGNDYVKSNSSDVKQEIKSEDTSDDFVAPTDSKSRKGKKVNKVVVEVPRYGASTTTPRSSKRLKPETPGPSTGPKQYMSKKHYDEETMVQKITEILVQHNFYKDGNTDIAGLVSNVRRIVQQGYIYKDEGTDDLTVSIAKVLLPKRMSLPAVTGIMCESINKSSGPDVQLEEPESILSTPTPVYQTDVNVPDSRRKRKAAIAAEKHIDSLSQDIIINLDDELDATDTDFVPDRVYKRKSSKEEINRENSVPSIATNTHTRTDSTKVAESTDAPESVTAKSVKPKPGPKTFKEKLKKKYKELTKNKDNALPSFEELSSNSILLSDEDEPLLDNSSPAISIAPTVSTETDEEVPLPLSLLTNKNFINIVAHTYLNGNPMLDADAATLAAQYSTYKSLKEAEQTGQDIVSGPIYDIAVKVIGKNLFKRMNNTSCKTVPVDEAHVTVELKEKMREITDKKVKDTKKYTKSKKTVQVDRRNSHSNEIISSEPAPIIPCSNGSVVPVGLIKTTANMESDEFASSECILPDDDDSMHIVPHQLPVMPQLQPAPAAPPPVTPVTPVTPAPVTLAPKRTPIILNHILAPKKKTIADPKPSNFIQINKGNIVMPFSVRSGNSLSKQPPATPTNILPHNDTICLDSDEEETITPTVIPKLQIHSHLAPVPVSLTTGRPTEITLSTSSLATPVSSAQGIPQKPLMLRQINAGSASKFVLVPANSVIATTAPKLLPRDTITTETTQLKMQVTTTSVESILSTTTPSPMYLNRIKQARCKPGDIIKISDKGEIEVLQANPPNLPASSKQPSNDVAKPKPDHVEATKPKSTASETVKSKPVSLLSKTKQSQSDIAKPKQSQSDVPKPKQSQSDAYMPKQLQTDVAKPKQSQNDVYKPKQSQSDSKPKPASQKPIATSTTQNEPSKTRSLSISSSSSDSRPASPCDNPLSILKNVVHIQAADETPSTSSNNNKSNVIRSHKSSDSNIFIQHIYASDTKNLTKAGAAKLATKISKESTSMKTKDTPKPKSVGKSSNTTSNVGKTSNIFNDLLLKKAITLKATKTGDKKPTTPLKSNVLEIKSTSSKSTKTVDLSKFNVAVGNGASILNTKIEAKKRLSTAEASTPKKKKTELPTLKDFSLDDIDDIIELD